MNTELDHQNCVLCNNNITRNENYSKESQLEFNNSQDDPLNSQLKIVFLIRKILGIPQDICCTFLEEHGNPNSWTGCCDSCSVLIEDGKHIFDQIMRLQNQFKTLKSQIKRQIIGIQMEKKFGEDQGKVEEIIRSYVCKESTFVKEENTEKHLSYSEVDVHESNFCLHAANYDTVIVHNELESDVYPPGFSITESKGNYFFEETDPLGPNENVKVKDENFELENDNRAHNVQIILPKSEPAFDFETSNMSSIFYVESEAANSNKPANKTTEHLLNNFKLKLRNKPETCGKLYTSGSDLDRHQRTHTGVKPYECLICGKCFVNNRNLKSHTNIHADKKPFKCNFCGKCFSKLGNLTVHARSHSGEKPYECNVCGQCFSQSSPLTVHKRRHTGEKPYKCNVCGKCFSQSNTLTRHKRFHTGEKPFKCNVCSKSFTQSSDLNRHKKSHTGEKSFSCEICGKTFSRNSFLTTHQRIHAREKPL